MQLGIGVVPKEGQMVAEMPVLRLEDESEISSRVWAEGGGRGLLNMPAIEVKMKPGIPPIRVKQYPISAEGKQGLALVIKELIEDKIIEPCMSPHNTPILPVRKSDGTYGLVQDLREVNKQTINGTRWYLIHIHF